jgi:hypothetical protein
MSYNLTDEDKKRIKGAEFYEHAKVIMQSFEDYGYVNTGEVYHIAYTNSEGSKNYVKRYGSERKDKFMVIHKDEGFIFAKRINSSGGMSKDVVCLTIRYPSKSYTLELDDEQAESIIFSKEDEFDPFKEGKNLAKKKNKARNINKKQIIKFADKLVAYQFVSTLKQGDKLYDASTGFGEGIVEWRVKSIVKAITNREPQTDWNGGVYAYGNTQDDRDHNTAGFTERIVVNLEAQGELPKSRRWINRGRTISFVDFLVNSRRDYYSSRPSTVDDV